MKEIVDPRYPLSQITGEIIGSAMEVHRHLGSGFPEFMYQRALVKEFTLRGINFQKEPSIDVFYKGTKIGYRQPDFLVGERVITELKALNRLESKHVVQALNYLESYKLEIGLLINFGASRLEFKRVINSRLRDR